MGGKSSIHVVNLSQKTVRARVAQEVTTLKEVDATVGLNGPQKTLNASVKGSFDYSLDTTGFARIAPKEALEFALPKGSNSQIYVSIATADDPEPLIICFNYSPPPGKSVAVTSKYSIVLSSKLPPPEGDLWESAAVASKVALGHRASVPAKDTWETEDGVKYTAEMARRIISQTEVDALALQLRLEAKQKKCNEKCDEKSDEIMNNTDQNSNERPERIESRGVHHGII